MLSPHLNLGFPGSLILSGFPIETKLNKTVNNVVPTAEKTQCIVIIKTNKLMLYMDINSVCSQIHTKHTNTLCGQNVELYVKTQSVPRSKHTPSRL